MWSVKKIKKRKKQIHVVQISSMKIDRYFIRGFIDGSLSTLGVVIGASGAVPIIVITAGLGGSVANGLSNLFGAFTAESAQVEHELSDIEKSMLSEGHLRDTTLHHGMRKRVFFSGVSDGVASISGGLIPVIPFLLIFTLGYTNQVALSLSISITISLLFLLGMYLGIVSKRNILLSGAKLALIGSVTAVTCALIEWGFRVSLG